MATYEKFASPEQAEPTPAHTVNQDSCDDLCRTGETVSVGQERVSHNAGPRISDEQREAAIVRAGIAMEHHMADLASINNRDPHIFSDFADAAAARWKAGRAREMMEQLIAGRSAEQIARMEKFLGLDTPACANEARRA